MQQRALLRALHSGPRCHTAARRRRPLLARCTSAGASKQLGAGRDGAIALASAQPPPLAAAARRLRRPHLPPPSTSPFAGSPGSALHAPSQQQRRQLAAPAGGSRQQQLAAAAAEMVTRRGAVLKRVRFYLSQLPPENPVPHKKLNTQTRAVRLAGRGPIVVPPGVGVMLKRRAGTAAVAAAVPAVAPSPRHARLPSPPPLPLRCWTRGCRRGWRRRCGTCRSACCRPTCACGRGGETSPTCRERHAERPPPRCSGCLLPPVSSRPSPHSCPAYPLPLPAPSPPPPCCLSLLLAAPLPALFSSLLQPSPAPRIGGESRATERMTGTQQMSPLCHGEYTNEQGAS